MLLLTVDNAEAFDDGFGANCNESSLFLSCGLSQNFSCGTVRSSRYYCIASTGLKIAVLLLLSIIMSRVSCNT
jgi:hypothetical protein